MRRSGFGYRDEHRPEFVLALCVVIALAAGLLTSCASTPDRIALSTLETAKVTADGYMRAVASQYALGRQYDPATKTWAVIDPNAVVVPEDTKAKSIVAYDKFAASAKAAAFALQTVTTPAQGDAIAAQVQADLAAFLALLRAFGVKI